MGITVVGALLTDLIFILVTTFSDKLPVCYWFLVIGPLIEGLLGGMAPRNTRAYTVSECDIGLASGTAANHAYVADTTTEKTR